MPPHDETAVGMRTPLSDYVNGFLKRTGMSKNAFVKACADPEDRTRVMYPQWLDTMLDGRGPAPELWRLRALAVGMATDLEQLKRFAAIQWLDYEIEEVATGGEVIMVPIKHPISEATRRRIRRMAELMIEEDEGSS